MLTKSYPKDNEPPHRGPPRRSRRPARRLDQRAELRVGDLWFATRDGTPFSRNTFRTRVWRPAVAASGVDFDVRVLADKSGTLAGSYSAEAAGRLNWRGCWTTGAPGTHPCALSAVG